VASAAADPRRTPCSSGLSARPTGPPASPRASRQKRQEESHDRRCSTPQDGCEQGERSLPLFSSPLMLLPEDADVPSNGPRPHNCRCSLGFAKRAHPRAIGEVNAYQPAEPQPAEQLRVRPHNCRGGERPEATRSYRVGGKALLRTGGAPCFSRGAYPGQGAKDEEDGRHGSRQTAYRAPVQASVRGGQAVSSHAPTLPRSSEWCATTSTTAPEPTVRPPPPSRGSSVRAATHVLVVSRRCSAYPRMCARACSTWTGS
jgi:hypothetical protein